MAVRSGTPVSCRDLHPLAESLFSRFVGELAEKLDDRALDRAGTCRDAIASLYGVPFDAAALAEDPVPLGFRVQRASFDSRHVSISDCVNVYSHTHDIDGIRQVSLQKTAIADHARLTYHATVPAGAHVGKDGMVGAMALPTRAETRVTAEPGEPGR